MTKTELQTRHIELHRAFDELLACFISQRPLGSSALNVTLGEFMKWSHLQTLSPRCARGLVTGHNASDKLPQAQTEKGKS